MKRLFTFVLLLIICSVGFCSETVEQRIAKLEQTVKAQSDSLVIYKAKVAEIELQRSFLSDIYNGNSAWLIGLVSLVVVLIVGISTYINWDFVNEIKESTKNSITDIKGDINTFKGETDFKHNDFTKETNENLKHLSNVAFGTSTFLFDFQFAEYFKKRNYYMSLYCKIISIKFRTGLAKYSTDDFDLVNNDLDVFINQYNITKNNLSEDQIRLLKDQFINSIINLNEDKISKKASEVLINM